MPAECTDERKCTVGRIMCESIVVVMQTRCASHMMLEDENGCGVFGVRVKLQWSIFLVQASCSILCACIFFLLALSHVTRHTSCVTPHPAIRPPHHKRYTTDPNDPEHSSDTATKALQHGHSYNSFHNSCLDSCQPEQRSLQRQQCVIMGSW